MLYIRASDREDLSGEEDTFYLTDLVGMRVVLQEDGALVGSVVEVCDSTGQHDCLRVLRQPMTEDEGVECTSLVPFVKAICPVVNAETKTIEITPPGETPRPRARPPHPRSPCVAPRRGPPAWPPGVAPWPWGS